MKKYSHFGSLVALSFLIDLGAYFFMDGSKDDNLLLALCGMAWLLLLMLMPFLLVSASLYMPRKQVLLVFVLCFAQIIFFFVAPDLLNYSDRSIQLTYAYVGTIWIGSLLLMALAVLIRYIANKITAWNQARADLRL